MSAQPAFRVLGPLDVNRDGRPVPVQAGKQRVVLATLLLRAGRTVSIQELVDNLWDGGAPADVRGTVQKYVMRLRRVLAGSGSGIRTEPDGYRIELPSDALDLHRWDRLTEQGTLAAETGDAEVASARLTEALALWRGVPPLSNVASEALHRIEVPRLVERYLKTLELRIDVDLRLGRHPELCEELIGLVRAHPLREHFWAQRMRALYAAGRQGEALEAYREVARLLADELGVDPGPELRAAHEEILRRSAAPAPAAGGFTTAVRQLPIAPSGVVGRDAEIERIVALLGGTGSSGTPGPVVVTGPAGVGKTTVAVHAAHRLAERFPDGQLFADLHEFADAPAQTAEDTLARFLLALGVPARAVPQRAEDAAALYRSLTAGRRLLVVLDDVSSPAQVRMLLPGDAGCGVLVTSRHELAGLLASPGGVRVPLGMLATGDAGDVLRGVLGEQRVAAEPDGTDALLDLCGGLPLALRVAAAGLATRPHQPISAFVAELRTGGPVSGLRVEGDGPTAVSTAVEASYRQLGAEGRRLLQVVSRLAPEAITAEAVAATTDVDPGEAGAGLDRLAETGLLARLPDGRYEMHTLTRAFTTQRAAGEGSGPGPGRSGPHGANPRARAGGVDAASFVGDGYAVVAPRIIAGTDGRWG